MGEWSAHWTGNAVVAGLSPARTTTCVCFTVAPSSNPRPTLVNGRLVCLQPVGILNNMIVIVVVIIFTYMYLQIFTHSTIVV